MIDGKRIAAVTPACNAGCFLAQRWGLARAPILDSTGRELSLKHYSRMPGKSRADQRAAMASNSLKPEPGTTPGSDRFHPFHRFHPFL